MDLLDEIEKQLTKMSEAEKDAWILSQAKLLSESEQEGILLSLSGVKKIIGMPMPDEISRFCEAVEKGEDWIRAVTRLTEGQDDRSRISKLLKMFDHPVCREVKPRILMEEGISKEMFIEMTKILEGEIAGLEAREKKLLQKDTYYRERYELKSRLDRKRKMLLDIRDKCLKSISAESEKQESKLAACWEQVQEGINWLSYEYIDDQPGIDTIQNICEALIRHGQLEQEDWGIRKKVLRDIIRNEYYDYYNCGDVMKELAKKLCTNRKEHLACADIMDASGVYREEAAYLYYEYGEDDKYISYLEEHLERRSKEYSALIIYYQEHGRQEDARRVAELGLERCKEDLSDCFICLMSEAQKNGDQKQLQKLVASAKRRKHVDVEKIKHALGQLD